MTTEQFMGLAALGWLIAAMLAMAWVVHRGRSLAARLAEQDPETYAAIGRPRPGFFHSARRRRFTRFVADREYEQLEDPALAAGFEAYRTAEARTLLALLLGLVVVSLLMLAMHLAA